MNESAKKVGKMELVQQRLETWMSEQRRRMVSWWGPLKWGMKKKMMIKEEYDRRRKQLQLLRLTVKADSISDLQDILACMVLSECVYKKPAAELVRAVNKIKADFGGEVVSLERVQPSSDHVPHRYLLAETGDTLFASFIGTKQYKDLMADANILQGAIFNEDAIVDSEEIGNDNVQSETRNGGVENQGRIVDANPKQLKKKPKPAVHRGFLARAKGIPALELYRLAQKKKRKLVLCGHSLGGAVAALATLAILRVIASSKENEKVLVKCITFSQPPVGNAALRDYVNRKGWQHYFKTYCIPEDLVPRILSPAYFHHYNAQPLSTVSNIGIPSLKSREEKVKDNEGEQLVLGLGPVQNSFWRLSRLVPLDSVKKQLNKYQGTKVPHMSASDEADRNVTSIHDDAASAPQSLEIQEGSDGISLKPFTNTDKGPEFVEATEKISGKSNISIEGSNSWRQVPYLPSYVPFGQLYILGNSSVESLSGAEYSKLTSVKSVIAELRERFQSHSMKSYRSRFQRIYDLCMGDYASSFLGLDQLQQFPHLQQWLGISMAGSVELGHIVESPVIRTATSIVPLGWNGKPGAKHAEPLKVDIAGFGLHLCTLVQAQVNGNWCSTTVESIPSAPAYYSDPQQQMDLQKMRVLIGPPLKRPPKHQIVVDSPMSIFSSMDSVSVNTTSEHNGGESNEGNFIRPEGLNDFVVYCTNDFTTVSREVLVRTRKVCLIGLEGAGKTSLFKAIVSQHRISTTNFIEHLQPEGDIHEYISGGLCYSDSEGINLQELSVEISRFRDELWNGIRDLSRKTDLIVLVHNLSHVIPRCHNSNVSELQPALSLLLNEAKVLGIPWILAITNKFSVSAHQQKAAIDQVLQAYNASPSTTGVINSFPYVMPLAGSATMSLSSMGGDSDARIGAQRLFLAPIDLVLRPFQKKATTLPIEGVTSLCQLVQCELRGHEEASLQELAKDRLLLELERERATAASAIRESQAKENALSAAAVGASLGAGLGIVLAVVMGAASALRKP